MSTGPTETPREAWVPTRLAFPGLSTWDVSFVVRSAVDAVDSVLEIGCGIGDYVRFTRPDQRVVAVEPHQPYIEVAQGRAPWAEYANMDGLSFLSGTDETFGCILLIDVVEHLPEADAIRLLAEVRRHAERVVLCQIPVGVHEQTHDAWHLGGEYWQTHRSTWNNDNLRRLGFTFFSIWEGYYPADANCPHPRDAAIAMWLADSGTDRFTILINGRQEGARLARTLDSLAGQSYPGFEAFVLTDHERRDSDLELRRLCERDSRVTVLALDDPVDLAHLPEAAPRGAAGRLVVLDAGEVLPPRALRRQADLWDQIAATKAGGAGAGLKLAEDADLEALRRWTFERWQIAYAEGYSGGMGDHRHYRYNQYLEQIGLYRDLERAGHTVEFGPGSGEFMAPLIAAHPEKRFTLVDVAEASLEPLRRRFEGARNVTCVLSDQAHLPLSPVDCAFSFLVCQSVPRSLWAEHLVEVRRCLAPGGAYTFQFADHGAGGANDSVGASLAGSQMYTADEMGRLVREAGFESITLSEPIDLRDAFKTDITWYLCRAAKQGQFEQPSASQRAVETLQALLDSTDITAAVEAHLEACDDEVMTLIRLNAGSARRDGKPELADGLENLAAYIEPRRQALTPHQKAYPHPAPQAKQLPSTRWEEALENYVRARRAAPELRPGGRAWWEDLYRPQAFDLGESGIEELHGVFSPLYDTAVVDQYVHEQFRGGAEHHSEKYVLHEHYKTLLGRAFQRIGVAAGDQRPLNVLDLGSGSGNTIIPLVRLLPGCQLLASEFSIEMLAALKRALAQHDLADRCGLLQLNAEELDFEPGSFDLVVGGAILHHLFSPDKTVRGCARILRPGGAAIFFEPFLDGQLQLQSAFRLILKHGPAESLAPEVTTYLRDWIHFIDMVKGEDKTDARFLSIDDKWLFTRSYFTRVARQAGFTECRIDSLSEPQGMIERQAGVIFDQYAGFKPGMVPEWAWEIIRQREQHLPKKEKRGLLIEGCVIFKK